MRKFLFGASENILLHKPHERGKAGDHTAVGTLRKLDQSLPEKLSFILHDSSAIV